MWKHSAATSIKIELINQERLSATGYDKKCKLSVNVRTMAKIRDGEESTSFSSAERRQYNLSDDSTSLKIT